ncbi:MAG: ethanolamine utilization protein EutH [Ruminococcaceae bacterium]|nr:ethanolamine utilization protein EutH [Oscillospiraceae bacterium]MBQ3216031.1 ethanolamine utilization protein EutH [Oscillospiraceae bacterium]
MSAHEIIIWIMAAFAVLGALDRIIGNRFGLGKEFENGILAMGSLAIAMIGIITLAPVLAALLRPVVVPVYRLLGADPAMFAGTILANDMGGGSLALELTDNRQAAMLGGVITGSMLGATIVFTIPVAMGILPEADRPAMAKGILCGIVTIPVGVLVGGLVAGLPIGMVTRNLIPIVLIAVLIALGLWKAEKWMIKGFGLFGKAVIALITIGLTAAIVQSLTGFTIIPGMAPIEDGFLTVGSIAIVLAGAFPLVFTITKVLKKPLMKLGHLLGINDTAAAGLVASLANSIATFGLVKDMDRRGKVVNIAFAVSAAFVFGDHLGFTAGFAPDMLPAVILGKLAGGSTAIAVALLLTRKNGNE